MNTPLFPDLEAAGDICGFCGLGLPPRAPGQPGRPRKHHEGCREVSARINQIAAILRIWSATPEKRASVRAALWRVANLANKPGGERRRVKADRPACKGIASRAGGSRAGQINKTTTGKEKT